MPIVGPVIKSGRWPDLKPDPEAKTNQHLLDRAWDIKKKVTRNILGSKITPGSRKIWEATIEDRDEGSCLGPFWSEGEISDVLGTQEWVPTQRFEVHQKNKVRGCDSATVNLVNVITQVLEKLQLPTTDENIAVIRELLVHAEGVDLAAWVVDERKAYRQIGVDPANRKFSVIAFKHYETGKIA